MVYELFETEKFTDMVYKDWQEGTPNLYDYIGQESLEDWDEDGNPQGTRSECAYLQMSPQKDGIFYWELGECFPGGRVISSGVSQNIVEATKQAEESYKKLGLNMEGLNDFFQ